MLSISEGQSFGSIHIPLKPIFQVILVCSLHEFRQKPRSPPSVTQARDELI